MGQEEFKDNWEKAFVEPRGSDRHIDPVQGPRGLDKGAEEAGTRGIIDYDINYRPHGHSAR